MYGQNKFDSKLDVKGKLNQNGGIPVQDSTGVAPLGGSIIPPYPVYRGAVPSGDGFNFADADPFTESATQLFPLGSTLNWGDRVFKYAQVDGAITAGLCVQQPIIVANHTQMSLTSAVAISTTNTTDISIETAGDTDLTANQYQEGYLYINDGTGQGQSWKIKSHPAHDHSSDPTCVITVYGKVSTALVASGTSQASLMENPFKDVIVAPVAETGAVVGVTVIDMTDDYYGWLQTKGPKAVLAASTLVLGHNAVRNDTSTAGAVMADNGDDLVQEIGTVMASVVVDSEYCMIDLNL